MQLNIPKIFGIVREILRAFGVTMSAIDEVISVTLNEVFLRVVGVIIGVWILLVVLRWIEEI